ncbi:MAG: Na+/H+ antiporter NhaA, partial [Pseudomonadota bacterium]
NFYNHNLPKVSMGNNISDKQEKGIKRFLKDFFETEASGGIIMLLAAALALLLANIPILSETYLKFIKIPVEISFGEVGFVLPLKKFIKDVFMVVFFLMVGLELKREMLEGFLSKKGQKLLPALAAAGGIALPALIFYAIVAAYPEYINGWAVPTATDIAFAIGVLAIVGKNIPAAARIFLLAIAIYDDLAAIIIVALFYGSGFSADYIVPLFGVLGILYAMNYIRIPYLTPYYVMCALLAVFLHKTGFHTTIAGVVTAMFIPMRLAPSDSKSPLGTAIHYLHPWVSYFILPLFAFASAGIVFSDMTLDYVFAPLPLAITLALFAGKQIGIFGLTYGSIKIGLAERPEGSSWLEIYAMSILAGIGFTMSLFIGLLAFSDPILQAEVKIGVILGSLLSTIWAVIVIKYIEAQRQKHIKG